MGTDVPTDCVLVVQQLHHEAVARLSGPATVRQAAAAELTNEPRHIRETVRVIIVRDAVISKEAMKSFPRLGLIVRAGVGTDNIDKRAAADRGIRIANTPRANYESVAEHAIALMLGLAKRIVPADTIGKRTSDLSRSSLQPWEVRGKTLGILGFGRAGQRVAAIARHGLEMNVQVWTRTPSSVENLGYKVARSLDGLLERSDVVSIHLPLTPETRGLLDSDQFALMRSTAVVINTSRADIIRRGELLRALRVGQIAGAAVDVLDDADVPAASVSGIAGKLLVTPHSAALTDEAFKRSSLGAAEAALNFLTGATGSSYAYIDAPQG